MKKLLLLLLLIPNLVMGAKSSDDIELYCEGKSVSAKFCLYGNNVCKTDPTGDMKYSEERDYNLHIIFNEKKQNSYISGGLGFCKAIGRKESSSRHSITSNKIFYTAQFKDTSSEDFVSGSNMLFCVESHTINRSSGKMHFEFTDFYIGSAIKGDLTCSIKSNKF